MRRIIIVAVIIVVIAIVIVAVFGYQAYQQRNALREIQVKVEGVKVDAVNLSTATLNISLRFTNPTTTTATLDHTDFTIILYNNTLGSGTNPQKVQIPAGGSTVVQIPFAVSYGPALKTAWSYLTQDTIEYRVVGTAFFDTFLGTVSVPYDFSGTTTK